MSLAANLVSIVRQEMEKHDCQRLVEVRLRCGVLSNVVPEALAMAFEIQTMDTPLAGAKLVLDEEPLRLACGACGKEFSPPSGTPGALFSQCPDCGEEIGHAILAGKELYIDHLEVE